METGFSCKFSYIWILFSLTQNFGQCRNKITLLYCRFLFLLFS